MDKWVIGNVIQLKCWTEKLFSLIVHAPISSFIAGQFTKLRLDINGEKIQRAYSYVNSPCNKNLEFYIVIVPEGKFSPFLRALQPGEKIIVKKEASGFFILDEIPSCKHLWMLSTGTALGPYLSILEHGKQLERFEKIVLVHATRFSKDLSYFSKMIELKKYYNNKLYIQTIVSREQEKRSLRGRITSLIANGLLESSVNLQITPETSHVMLCGNPNMVNDVQILLKNNKNMRKHLKNKPGHITSENYW